MSLTQHRDEEEFLALARTEAARSSSGVVVVLGSSARGSRATTSDLDVLLIDCAAPEGPPTVHVIELETADLTRRINSGDDFAQWALRFGVPLAGRGVWQILVESLLPRAPWPDASRKIVQAQERLRISTDLLEVGDSTSAQKEGSYAASHTARAYLLRSNVFPLSRPELPSQLQSLTLGRLADALDQLASPNNLPRHLVDAALGVVDVHIADWRTQ